MYEIGTIVQLAKNGMNKILVSDIQLPYTNTTYLYTHSAFEMYLHSNLEYNGIFLHIYKQKGLTKRKWTICL